MRTIILTYFLVNIFFTAPAQLTLTSSQMPVSGICLKPYNTTDTLLNQGPSGPNVTWDYSTLHYVFQVAVPDICYQDFIGYSNLGYTQSGGLDSYTENNHSDSSTYTLTHTSYHEGGAFPYTDGYDFSDDIMRLTFPFTYNDWFKDSFYFDHYSSGLSSTIHYYGPGVDSTIADAWGTLILGTDTFDVLRVYYHDVYSDTSWNGSYSQKIEEVYSWYTLDYYGPILEYRISSLGPHYNTFMIYYDYLHPLPVNEVQVQTKPYCYLVDKNVFAIRFDKKPDQQFESLITDASGKIISTPERSGNDNELLFDLSRISSGIYFLTLYNSRERFSFKLANIK